MLFQKSCSIILETPKEFRFQKNKLKFVKSYLFTTLEFFKLVASQLNLVNEQQKCRNLKNQEKFQNP